MRALLLFFLLLALRPAFGHEGSLSYLSLTRSGSQAQGEWLVAVKDLDLLYALDQNEDHQITWGELRSRFADLDRSLLSHLQFQADTRSLNPIIQEHLVENRSGTAYLVLRFLLEHPPQTLAYSFYFESDSSHRVILQNAGNTVLLTSDRRAAVLAAKPSWTDFLTDGATHIWGGLDHILFLFALLLPIVLRGQAATRRFNVALFVPILKVVTAFTVAHSITLALAVTGSVVPPSRLVESIIAASVLLAAVNNLKPLWDDHAWPVAFVFGLFHGFGFAGPLMDAGLGFHQLLPALGLFNLGVELGQAVIVGLAVPVLFFIGRNERLRLGTLRIASCAIALISGLWFAERAFNLAL